MPAYLTGNCPAFVSLATPNAPRLTLPECRHLDGRRHDARELAALQQLAAFAAAAGHLVLRGANRLLRSARRLDRQQIAIADRRNESQQPIIVRLQLDQNDAAARAAEVAVPAIVPSCLSDRPGGRASPMLDQVTAPFAPEIGMARLNAMPTRARASPGLETERVLGGGDVPPPPGVLFDETEGGPPTEFVPEGGGDAESVDVDGPAAPAPAPPACEGSTVMGRR